MFLILPMGVDYSARRYPVVTFTMMGICTAVYLITLVCELSFGFKPVHQWVFAHLWLTPSLSHWWTYITSVFVHAGLLHLVGNMVYLFLFGSCVEDIIGRLRFTLFYLLAGVISAFLFILSSEEHFASEIPLGGASGAISACIGGFVLLLVKTKINFRWFLFFIFRFFNGEFSMPAWLVISFWFLQDFGKLILVRMAHVSAGVAFGAHVGGMLFGAGWMALEKIRLRRIGDDYDAPEPELPIVSTPIVAVSAVAIPRVKQKSVFIVGEKPTIHIAHSGIQSGPFKLSQVEHMASTGEIPPDAFYWKEGMAEWRPVEDLRTPSAET